MDAYWKLISKALRNDNIEELQCLLTGYKDDTFKFQIENCFKLPANINRSFQNKRSIYSKAMCYVNMCPVVNDYNEKEETTLLHLAVSQYSPEAVWLLLQHGANPNTFQFKPFGTTLLFTLINLEPLCKKYKRKFCDSKLKDIINLLIEFDADLYNLTPDGLSFLHVAVTKEYDVFTELFEIILSQTCFNINYPIPGNSLRYMNEYNFNYSEGDTALHVLTKRHSGVSQICKVLLKHGINLNARNMDGCSAFHYALGIRIFNNYWPSPLMGQHIIYIQFLLEHGARLDILDCNNESPIVYFYTNVMNQKYFKPDGRSFENGKVHMKGRMEILRVLVSGGAMTRSALKEVSSLNPELRGNFEYMILSFYTHTWLFQTLVEIRYPFLFLNKMSEHYQLYSIPQSLKRLSAMVLYSSLKPNVLCGIQKLLVPASIRDYVTLGKMEILYSNTWEPIYSDKHWQDQDISFVQ